MQENRNNSELRLMVTGTRRDGRRCYDLQSKRELARACLEPGISLAGMALKHGVNANLLRKWVVSYQLASDATENGGYRIGSQWFHSDQKSRSQQLGLVLLGKNVPSNLQWKTMDGSFAVMTLDLAQQVITASRVSDQAIFDAAEEHRAAMEACTGPVDYDFSVGWPKMFGE